MEQETYSPKIGNPVRPSFSIVRVTPYLSTNQHTEIDVNNAPKMCKTYPFLKYCNPPYNSWYITHVVVKSVKAIPPLELLSYTVYGKVNRTTLDGGYLTSTLNKGILPRLEPQHLPIIQPAMGTATVAPILDSNNMKLEENVSVNSEHAVDTCMEERTSNEKSLVQPSKCNQSSKGRIKQQNNIIKCLKLKLQRYKSQCEKMKRAIDQLNKEKILNNDATDTINFLKRSSIGPIISRFIENSKHETTITKEYDPEFKEIALTLYKHSTSAYLYLKNTVGFSLPAISTIKHWCRLEKKLNKGSPKTNMDHATPMCIVNYQ